MSTLATLSVVSGTTPMCVGEDAQIQVVLRVQGDAVNAAQGTLRYNPAHLNITSVSTGRSVFRFWALQPSVNQEKGTVTFAGGLPTPGFSGDDGLVLTLNVQPSVAVPETSIVWDPSSVVLLNDGEGTLADTTLVGASIGVSEATSKVCAAEKPTPTPVTDSISPEPFDVIISRTDDAFQGQYFASYYAYDIDSGVVRYEVRENGDAWYQAWSPYVLRTQTGSVLLEVKAVDAFGNQRIASASAFLDAQGTGAYGPWWFWLIALLGIALGVWRIVASPRNKNRSQTSEAKPEASIPRVVYDQAQSRE